MHVALILPCMGERYDGPTVVPEALAGDGATVSYWTGATAGESAELTLMDLNIHILDARGPKRGIAFEA